MIWNAYKMIFTDVIFAFFEIFQNDWVQHYNQQEFDERFSEEQACYDYLFRIRWPQGFHCPRCEHTGYWMSSRGLCICCRCEYYQPIAAGTILHSTKKPLRALFKAMWWFTTRKSGVNAVNLKDLLGLGSYNTAWRWLQKLRSCTIRKGREKLSGHVEVSVPRWPTELLENRG